MEDYSFGYHLMIDCYDCKPSNLYDLSECYKFLEELVELLKMHK